MLNRDAPVFAHFYTLFIIHFEIPVNRSNCPIVNPFLRNFANVIFLSIRDFI